MDRGKIQTDIVVLRSTIGAVVGGAQFNGQNLVDGTQTTVKILTSLNCMGTRVTASSIAVMAQDLSIGVYIDKIGADRFGRSFDQCRYGRVHD